MLVRRDPQRVTVLQLEDQITRLVGQGSHAPFAVTVGIGQAGERVARQLHQRTGWFPMIRRVDVTREEDGQELQPGEYHGPTTRRATPSVETCLSLAVVDDTVFSGLTMRTVLRALPPAVLARTHAFCLRGVAESLRSMQALCPITIGFAAPGHLGRGEFHQCCRAGAAYEHSACGATVASLLRSTRVDACLVPRLR